ncbi:MAG: class I SAM-dependent methyltransferase [Treponema sp.]|nr:class I SAM-dependent methyltransferase [Treponema sp.]
MDYRYDKSDQNELNYIHNYKNTVCPKCKSKPRHRIICYFFNEKKYFLNESIISKILMFGAEPCIMSWFKMHGFKYTTADLYNRADIKVDIQKTPFPDECWSLIICNHVLQHVGNYYLALQELKRILKKQGILELTVAKNTSLETVFEDKEFTEEQRMEKLGQKDYLRIFGNNFKEILIEIGFFVEIIDGNNLPQNIRGVIGPGCLDENKIYICRKL